MSAELTKEDYIVNYIKSIATIEEAMVPYREQRKDLRKSYVDNGWLEKEDIKVAIRAYRLMKQDVDFDELRATYRTIKQQKNAIGIIEDDEE
jgi:F0F1-type ATP synthase epsilon subunit